MERAIPPAVLAREARTVQLDRHVEELREIEIQERHRSRRHGRMGWVPADGPRRGSDPKRERDASRTVEIAQRQREDAVPPDYGLLETWLSDQPGHPLGSGMPLGAPLRMDGESHSNAWRRILRADPCAYCGAPVSGTVDHVVPKAERKRDRERWVNLVGACGACNGAKQDTSLLRFLLVRATNGLIV